MSQKSFTEAAHAVVLGMDVKHRISQLQPRVQGKAYALIFLLAFRGYGMAYVTETSRSLSKQYELFGKGRTEEELRKEDVPARYAQPTAKCVTWCKPETSDHVRGTAIDVNMIPYERADLTQVDAIARALNICWGGLWSVKDYCHFSLDKPYGAGR